MLLPFAEFRPDAAVLGSGFTAFARNVFPTSVGYRPALSKVAYSDALPDTCRGFAAVQTQDGSWRIFAATRTKLYRLDTTNLSWTDVSEGGGTYTGPGADESWQFAFYLGHLYATNVNDPLQRFEVEAGSAFATVSGSPPQARLIGVVEDYLVLGALTDDTSAIAWCDTLIPTTWSGGNANSQSFPNGGPVMAISGAARRILQQRAERSINYLPGNSVVFAFEEVANATGTVAPGSVIQVGNAYACLAEDGFRLNGEPIGAEKVDEYFRGLVNRDRLYSVIGGYDPLRRLFRWAFRTGSSDTYDWQLIYSPATGRWSEVVDDILMIGEMATAGTTLEGLDADYPSLDDDVPASLDSAIWRGGRPVFAVMGTDNRLSFYEGPTLEGLMETPEAAPFDGLRGSVVGVRPIVDGDTGAAALARVGARERTAGDVSYTSYSALQASGRCPVRKNGRYFRAGVKMPAGSTWTQGRGVEVDPQDIMQLGRR